MVGHIYLEDGRDIAFFTDKTWEIRINPCFVSFFDYDNTLAIPKFERAKEVNTKWGLTLANINLPIDEEIKFNNSFKVKNNASKSFKVDFPVIYCAYFAIEVKCHGLVKFDLTFFETENKKSHLRKLTFDHSDYYRNFDPESLGGFELSIDNQSSEEVEVIIHVFHCHYPYKEFRQIKTNNNRLNDLFDKCKFAAINCSQSIFLDSPKHLEPLSSCMGDYQIISLLSSFASGDYELSEHVLRGCTYALSTNKGLCANLSYALIYISWLYKIYMFTGDRNLLRDCLPGVEAVNKKFFTFIGENGLIDRPNTYCFVDWLCVDGFSLFAPPKALGQSVFNMFYYEALNCTSKIYTALKDEKLAKKYSNRAKKMKKAINSQLFDADRGLYIEGLPTPNPPGLKDPEINKGIPENINKVYYRKHANILAVAYGLANKKTSKSIIHKIFNELWDLEIQPYFAYYLFEAIHAADLDNKYCMKLVKWWLTFVKIKDKGLPEGVYKPEPAYEFDYSHAWACSPYYGFILGASNIKILEPGMRKISLNLHSFGLKEYSYSIGTPYGFIEITKNLNEEPKVVAPKEIEIVFN